MRRTLHFPYKGTVAWNALHEHPVFLYRRIADQQRAVLGIGVLDTYEGPTFGHSGRVQDWIFGHLCYDLKNELEQLEPRLLPAEDFPLSQWFVPRWVIEWRGTELLLHVHPNDEAEGVRLVEALCAERPRTSVATPAVWVEQTTREDYLKRAEVLLDHIQRGDIYEVNYCTERRAQLPGWDPYAAFQQLLQRSDAPFAAFHRLGDHFALCASPERFLSFQDDRIVGQPMKGTRPRSTDVDKDRRFALDLASDDKERSENIMALDVMRNDLSRVAASGSVLVEELCGVHAYEHVYQMVSTVSARLREGLSPFDAVLAAFPMASMTGAPKLRAMQLIDAAEERARGLFSGTLGFFAPDGSGDLNVVIRTVLYDAATGQASLTTGSALTATCDPEREWEECALKARSVIEALSHGQ